jgi:hypothetical protein
MTNQDKEKYEARAFSIQGEDEKYITNFSQKI